jgi:feruloyl esterase
MWRLHISVRTGKKLVESFYGKPHDKSYYLGCSLGGRQGIKAAEKFPGDFDGIVAGAPAVDFNNLASWRANFFPITGVISSPDFISASTWKSLIHDEILRQCDGLDGVVDGIIEDPNLCDFNPETLRCIDANTKADCLTSIQVEKVRKIFTPLYSEDGHVLYPAMQPGSEIMAVTRLYAGEPFSYSEVHSPPPWT